MTTIITFPERSFTADVATTIKQHADTGAVVALVDYSGDFASPAGLKALAPHGVNTERLLCATLAEHGGACADEDALDAMAATFEMIANVVVVARGTAGEWVPELLRCADCGREIETTTDVLCDRCHDARDAKEG